MLDRALGLMDTMIVIMGATSYSRDEFWEMYYGGASRRRRRENKNKPKDPTRQQAANVFYKLKKRGFIEMTKDGKWKRTRKAEEHIKDLETSTKRPHNKGRSNNKMNEKGIIIAFDIPERHHKKRDWLRRDLISLGFTQIQKSVWHGPAPLPNDLVEAMRDLKLLPYCRFFEAKESEII